MDFNSNMRTDLEMYDDRKIGRCIAWTGDHSVYEYGEQEVIKFSKFDLLLGYKKALEKSLVDIELCRKYFGEYYLDTRVAISKKSRRVALIQLKISGEFLELTALENKSIKSQLAEILKGYKELINAGYAPVDLIGGKGAFRMQFSNIFVTPTDHLYIFDATLLDLKPFPLYSHIFMSPLFHLAIKFQNTTIKAFEERM